MTSEIDTHYMRIALAMACRGFGRCAPNPSVGCVLVKGGRILAKACTADGGRPHAEALALEKAGALAKGATAYVTLEPCAHHGKTPPCAESLVQAGIAHVVIGCVDPDPRVSGAGVKILEDAGVSVSQGVCEAEALEVHSGFFLRLSDARPLVALKVATTSDGKVATESGESKWITGGLARAKTHQLRSQYDAILCGVGTVLADDPSLTTRIEGHVHRPVRVILDSYLKTSLDAQVIGTAAAVPTWIFYEDDREGRAAAFEDAGVTLFQTKERSIVEVLRVLASEGITRLFVEGGAQIHGQFLSEGLVDELYWFRAPKILGGGAMESFSGFSTESLSDAFALRRMKTISLGEDMLEIYKRKG